ncbi:MAG: hypothetical protein HN350_06625 [Phycisphaerales bacterium]|jgi:hypothetical protein|nr:hypothetical protein [Phycisphaerales bacterium]
MITAGQMLVLAERSVVDEFADHLGSVAIEAFDDPYEAFAAMQQRVWSRVVIAASYAGLGGLCRAVRRLQPQANVLVLCGPGRESEVRSLADGINTASVIDDYFIYPLTPVEWRNLAETEQPAVPVY